MASSPHETSERMIPRTIYVAVSTHLLSELRAWSEPLQVKVEIRPDDTYEMMFRKLEADHCP